MQMETARRCGLARTGFVVLFAGFLGACADQSSVPAPVYLRGAGDPVFAPAPVAPPAHKVVVQRGQTLDGVAHTYHVPKGAIIAANGLHAPYELKAGMHLTIPSGGAPIQQVHAMPPPSTARPPQTIAQVTPLSPPPGMAAAKPQAGMPIPQPPATPQTLAPPSAAKAMPEVIPLDGPPPAKQGAAPQAAALNPPQTQAAAPPAMPARNATAALPLPGEAPAPAASTQANGGGRFPWPVRGRVVAGYGNAPGGGHNDGINIAAPRGTPVRSIDGGTVAYAGNEVKGYGNIVLIKHANGWISAYAHLDDIAVKPGDTIAPGQVIAKVGESGGVGEPQLHFELRRGKRPVDPKEFLAPAPSAGIAGNKAG